MDRSTADANVAGALPAVTGLLEPRVSVVVPVLNGEATIEACVDSLLSQERLSIAPEIIVVDNGSTDATADVLRRFGSVRVLRETTRGSAAARNAGVRAATGSVVAFIDADATAERDWLAALLRALQEPGVGIVGGAILCRRGGNRIERFGERIHDQRRAIEEERPPYVAAGNWASPRSVLVQAGLFDETLLRAQDVDLAWRIHQRGGRLVYAPDAVVRHRNERTLWGLVHEGYVHGRHGVSIGIKHANDWPHVRRRVSGTGRRVTRAVSGLLRAESLADGLIALAFECGKCAGEVRALMAGSRQ